MTKYFKPMNWMKSAIGSGLDILYPKAIYCMACGKAISGTEQDSLCPHCRRTLLWDLPRQCVHCGRFLKLDYDGIVCEDCMGSGDDFMRGTACCIYESIVRTMIMRLKYGGKGYLAESMAYIMSRKLESLPDYDVIVPVPMYRKKEKNRGYNQAELLANALSCLTGKPCFPEGLVRIQETKPMSSLSLEERKLNIKNVLQAPNPKYIREQTVLMVDDIFTTGSTLRECGKALISAGARDVFFIAFAATPAEHSSSRYQTH